eukprot:GDKI01014719.1.p1 GENE.GDKI01014719.1~~GDKI01014719.1.p1  ORF type:complete len:145 (+),score=7.30 GDKI01014719.1:30-437(+)
MQQLSRLRNPCIARALPFRANFSTQVELKNAMSEPTPASSSGVTCMNEQESHEALQRQRVIRWNNDKICTVCKKTIARDTLERIESACPKLWRYLHGMGMRNDCPMHKHQRVKKLGDVRSTWRERFFSDLVRPKQ